jgi:hypothetical protein
MASIDASQRMLRITRTPGHGYGIHVSAWVHASSDAARNAGQTSGTSKPFGQTARNRSAIQSSAMATAPKSIGQPARPASLTGRVNMRGG